MIRGNERHGGKGPDLRHAGIREPQGVSGRRAQRVREVQMAPVDVTIARGFTSLETFRERWRHPFPERSLVQADVHDATIMPGVAPQLQSIDTW
jgi:hypothetical protein